MKHCIVFDFTELFYYSFTTPPIFSFIFIPQAFSVLFLFTDHKPIFFLSNRLQVAFVFVTFTHFTFLFVFTLIFFIIIIFKVFLFLIVTFSSFLILIFSFYQLQTLFHLLSRQARYCQIVNCFYFASMMVLWSYFAELMFSCYFSSMKVVNSQKVIYFSSMKVGLKLIVWYYLFINFFSSMVV